MNSFQEHVGTNHHPAAFEIEDSRIITHAFNARFMMEFEAFG
jgi:hypothetical protein